MQFLVTVILASLFSHAVYGECLDFRGTYKSSSSVELNITESSCSSVKWTATLADGTINTIEYKNGVKVKGPSSNPNTVCRLRNPKANTVVNDDPFHNKVLIIKCRTKEAVSFTTWHLSEDGNIISQRYLTSRKEPSQYFDFTVSPSSGPSRSRIYYR